MASNKMQLQDIMEMLIDVLKGKLISYTTMNASPKLVTKHSQVLHIQHFGWCVPHFCGILQTMLTTKSEFVFGNQSKLISYSQLCSFFVMKYSAVDTTNEAA